MLDVELERAIGLAREAGRILLDVYKTDFSVESKGQNGPVTAADRRANEYLVAELRRLFPHDGIVAEETADHSDALKRGRCWYVDPLDGTREFVAKRPEFSVMIGLAIEGAAKLGVVYQPLSDQLYAGIVGEGAFLENAQTKTVLRVSTTADCKSLKLVTSRSHRPPETDLVVQRLGITHELSMGSVGLKIGLIAEQKADIYVHLSTKSSAWDACGPEAILRAAGGQFTTLTGEPFVYEGLDMQNRGGIFACNAAAYNKALPIIADVALAMEL